MALKDRAEGVIDLLALGYASAAPPGSVLNAAFRQLREALGALGEAPDEAAWGEFFAAVQSTADRLEAAGFPDVGSEIYRQLVLGLAGEGKTFS